MTQEQELLEKVPDLDTGKMERQRENAGPEELFEGLIARVRKYHPSDDLSMIEKAYEVARKAHGEQKRRSGEPYIIHPLNVAIILADLEMDKETITGGILHDVAEDTVMTLEEIREEFGSDVELLVDGVTKLKKLRLSGDYNDRTLVQQEMQARNLRKMFLAMARDIRVIVIKLADRLHNMRTLGFMPPDKQRRIAQETLDIYSPIAARLGISKIKVELEDLAMKYLKPDIYYDLVERMARKMSEREKFLQSIVQEVRERIAKNGIEGTVDGRVKHYYSIYRKMVNQDRNLDQIYDLFAIRIIVSSVKDCYAALGVMHEMYKPIPGRFKDYIAMPKPNMYQSLHTSVIGATGFPFEIQIRTYEMHRAAEYGIAAHWKYKEGVTDSKGDKSEEEKLAWLRQILEWQRDMPDNREFMDILKSDLDLFSDEVYCFTPRGEVKTLPMGSTPIDFAYSIHSAVGNRMTGARVNGRIVNIDYRIRNGDRVEILTSPNSKGPSLDWLSAARSPSARNKINQWFRRLNKEENIETGRDLMTQYCKSKNYVLADLLKPAYQEEVQRKYGFHDWDAVMAAIGHGGLKEGQIVNKLHELYEQDHKKQLSDEEILAQIAANKPNTKIKGSGQNSIIVKGIHDVAVRFSKCCNPVPGDSIVGFVTRGRGVSIHRSDCVNIRNLPDEEKQRVIEASWNSDTSGEPEGFLTEISIYANDRPGLLNEITKIFSGMDVSLLKVNTAVSRHGIATLTLAFEIRSKEQLRDIITKLQAIRDVQTVKRTSS